MMLIAPTVEACLLLLSATWLYFPSIICWQLTNHDWALAYRREPMEALCPFYKKGLCKTTMKLHCGLFDLFLWNKNESDPCLKLLSEVAKHCLSIQDLFTHGTSQTFSVDCSLDGAADAIASTLAVGGCKKVPFARNTEVILVVANVHKVFPIFIFTLELRWSLVPISYHQGHNQEGHGAHGLPEGEIKYKQ